MSYNIIPELNLRSSAQSAGEIGFEFDSGIV